MKLSKVFVAATFITATLAVGSASASAYSVEEAQYLTEHNGTYISPFIMFGEIGQKWGRCIAETTAEVAGAIATANVEGGPATTALGIILTNAGKEAAGNAGEYLGDKIEDHVVRPIIDHFRKDK